MRSIRYPVVGYMECDRDPASETGRAQPRPQIVPTRSTLRERRETEAVADNALGIGLRPVFAGLLRDVIVQLQKIVSRFGCEDDFMRHACGSSDARHDGSRSRL